MSAIEDRERAVLIDLSRAVSSADAVRLLEEYLEQSSLLLNPGSLVDVNTGELLLTPGVLSKIKGVIKRFGVGIETLYSAVPQTQQSALDEGLLVRRQLPTNKRFSTLAFKHTSSHAELALPFDSTEAMQPPVPPKTKPEPLSRLSVTLEDGRREAVENARTAAAEMETVYYRQTLRSGQVLEANGHVVIVGDAHPGSEVYADGDILVWGVLGGIAHAGRQGYDQAEIRAIRIEAVQLRIGHAIARRPDRLFKVTHKRRGPEVARIQDGEIQIYEDIVER